MSQEKKPPRSQYLQDGARPKKKDSGTVDPLEYKVFKDEQGYKQVYKDGTEKKGKNVEKAFVGEDALDDLSGRIINSIGNNIRLKIIRYMNSEENSKRDISENEIYKHLKKKYNIDNSGLRQNHLKPLVDAGLIEKKESLYKAIPGALESLLLNISKVTKLQTSLNEPLDSKYPEFKILGGPQDLKPYKIKKNPTLLGRRGDLEDDELEEYSQDLTFDNYYKSVTRIYNPDEPGRSPHAKLTFEDGDWYIEDCRSNSFGTFVNEDKIYHKTKLEDHDMIGLSRGKYSVDLLFRKPGSSPFTNYNRKLSPEEREKLDTTIDVLLSKLDTAFLLRTLDLIIDRVRHLEEIESVIPNLEDDEDLDPTHDEE